MLAAMKRERFDFVQFSYSFADRDAEKRLLPMAADRGAAVVINRPFDGGNLFGVVKGKPLPPRAQPPSRHGRRPPQSHRNDPGNPRVAPFNQDANSTGKGRPNPVLFHVKPGHGRFACSSQSVVRAIAFARASGFVPTVAPHPDLLPELRTSGRTRTPTSMLSKP